MLPSNLKISILVDYAHEPESMKQLLNTLRGWKENGLYSSIIHIVSCDGAGRDDWKKPVMGKISFDLADFSVITLDNYDDRDNPDEILELLSSDCDKSKEGEKFSKTPSRREAFQIALGQAVKIAENNRDVENKVIIVSTGVGSENGLTQPGKVIKWDEKTVWKEEFEKLLN